MPAYEIDSAHQLANTIESALLPGEGALLFETARGLTGRGCIVEIGSWRGRSTIYLGYGSRNGSRATVHAIDPHTGSRESLDKFGEIDTFAEFQANIARAGIEDLVQPHVATSDVVARNWSQPVEFLFIDGAHDYEFVRQDWDLWWPHVVDGGWIALHDTNVECYPGVKRVVEESVFASREVRGVRHEMSLLLLQKTGKQSSADRLGLRAAHILRYPDDWKRRLGWGLLPAPLRKAGLKLLRRTR